MLNVWAKTVFLNMRFSSLLNGGQRSHGPRPLHCYGGSLLHFQLRGDPKSCQKTILIPINVISENDKNMTNCQCQRLRCNYMHICNTAGADGGETGHGAAMDFRRADA
jgi:hypothetical protein